MSSVTLYHTTVSSGLFLDQYVTANIGDVIHLTERQKIRDVFPHRLGMIGTVETAVGLQVYINNDLHHLAHSSVILPFNDDVAERVGNNLERVIIRKNKVSRKKIYHFQDSVPNILPHSGGGIVIVDDKASTISLIEITPLSLRYRIGLKPRRIVHIGEWIDYALCEDGVIVNCNGQFFKDRKMIFKVDEWQKDYIWWPFGNDIAIRIDGAIIDRKSGKRIWKDANDGEIFSCQGNLVWYHDSIVSICTPDSQGLPQHFEFDIPIDQIVAEHWLGLLFKRKEAYKLLVVK